ncbi:hypothetical protein J2T60_002213 [Natronospira proteinivora]|uniref:Phospholipase D-like protein n=1 Tax=Natronospira proteinivora TaxID=1807133 RepID=A0ABT1GD72_9GAMM|nr:hypothetical protein [Natronospira proteinivora]MCP1728213.1 hypothetical protein [Natronospira proteinivora]
MVPLLGFLLLLFLGLCWYRIAGKAGFQPWLGLLMLVPVVNLGFLAWFAFTDWPIHRHPGED